MDMDLAPQMFVVVEKATTCECKDMATAIFTMTAVHYVFNITYHPTVKDVFFYLQEAVLKITDSTYKSSSTYSNVTAGIDSFLESD